MTSNSENQYSSDLEPINKIIGSYGDKSVSKIITHDKEMINLMEEICNIIETEAGEETVIEIEELLNAYTARGMRIAYLVGFKDCMEYKQAVDKIVKD